MDASFALNNRPEKPALPPQQDGVLVLNKPGGLTSAACIAKIKRGLGQKKIGHAGTLDPMAKGVLLVLLGQATKLSGPLLEDGEKIYSGLIRLGLATDTWDIEGRVLEEPGAAGLDADAVRRAILDWQGESEQLVPPYSAAKHQGRPLYELARKGLDVPVKTKLVKISRVQVESVDLPLARFRVACGSGTYIRSLAHSLGMRLGCGATLMELTREYSHPFGLDKAANLEDLLANPRDLPSKVRSLESCLPAWPKIRISAADSAKVRNGTALPMETPEARQDLGSEPTAGLKAFFQDADGRPLALVQSQIQNGRLVWAIERGLWNQ